MARLKQKVAFISGVARGQGRSHAIRLAQEGANIIGFDLCAQIDSVPYPLATREDLDETVNLVEKEGGRIVVGEADVRDPGAVSSILDRGIEEFGYVDIVLANAGIMPTFGPIANEDRAWHDAVDVMLSGVFNTVRAAIPHLIARDQGGAIVITSSTTGLKGLGDGTAGTLGYVAAKHGVVGLMRAWANALGPHFIRVNTVHPTGVNTPMVANEASMQWLSENPAVVEQMINVLPVPMVEPEDISNAIVWLVSDEGQYVTGATIPVDAGFLVR
jgi:SDR family mycofactocin-dependent oxidoreductase